MAFRCDGVKYVKYIRARDAYSYNDSRPLIPTKRDECTYAAKPNTKESIQYRSCVTPHKEAISITLELVAPLTRRRTDYYIDFTPYEEARLIPMSAPYEKTRRIVVLILSLTRKARLMTPR